MNGELYREQLPDGTGSRLRLEDGRFIGVREAGDPHGWPLLVFPGTPGSRLTPLPDLPGTREEGARAIAVERPGFGASTPLHGRTVLGWARDVAEIADALGLDRFAVCGMSGAGPYLAACALALPERVRAVGMLGVAAPLDAPGVTRGMTLRRRAMYHALPLAPHALPLLRALGASGIQRLMTDDVPARDKELIERVAPAYAAMKREAFRQGPAAFAEELALVARPWGFRLQDIRVPVHLWHGELDVSTPVAMGRYLAVAIPGCRAHFLPGEGHFLAYAHWRAILRALAP